MKKKYRIGIELYGVRFGVRYGTNLKKLKKEAKKDIYSYQKNVSRHPAKICIDEDTGERYMEGQRKRINWKRVTIETVPYEARPMFEIGQQFVQYEEEDHECIKMEAIIVERRLDSKYDDFYYTLRRNGYDDEEKEYVKDEIEIVESYLHSYWERKKELDKAM